MIKSLGIIAIAAGLLGFLGAGTIFLSPDSNIMVSVFLVLFALLSIWRGIVATRHRGNVNSWPPFLLTAGIAGSIIGMAVIGMALMALTFN